MRENIAKGVVGVGSSAATIVVSFSSLEQSLRIIALLAGISVSVASLVSILISIYKQHFK